MDKRKPFVCSKCGKAYADPHRYNIPPSLCARAGERKVKP